MTYWNVDHKEPCSTKGAEALKQRIEAYWREKGCTVRITVGHDAFHKALRMAPATIRSDMVNGYPRDWGKN